MHAPGGWLYPRPLARAAITLGVVVAVSGSWGQGLDAQSSGPAADSNPFAYDASQPLGWRDSIMEVIDEVEMRSVQFRSPQGGTVTGRIFVPRRASATSRVAGIVISHGAPGSTAQLRRIGVYFARRGAVVLAVDAAFARRDPQVPMQFTRQDSVEQVQTLVDFRRAVDALVARPDVDPARIGYVGISYSAAVGAALAGIEPRIAAFALAVGDLGIADHFREADGSVGGPARRLGPAGAESWARALDAVSATALLQRADGRKLLLQNNRQDQFVSRHAAEALHRAAPAGATLRWYPGDHRVTPEHFVEQLQFFHDRIGTDAPTAEDALGMAGVGNRDGSAQPIGSR